MIEAVLFDLDVTLVNREVGARNWLQARFEGFFDAPTKFEEFYSDFQRLYGRG